MGAGVGSCEAPVLLFLPSPLLFIPALVCRMIQAAENEVAEMAREAARADAMARAARKAEMGDAQQLELQRLKVGYAEFAGRAKFVATLEMGEAQQLELRRLKTQGIGTTQLGLVLACAPCVSLFVYPCASLAQFPANTGRERGAAAAAGAAGGRPPGSRGQAAGGEYHFNRCFVLLVGTLSKCNHGGWRRGEAAGGEERCWFMLLRQ